MRHAVQQVGKKKKLLIRKETRKESIPDCKEDLLQAAKSRGEKDLVDSKKQVSTVSKSLSTDAEELPSRDEIRRQGKCQEVSVQPEFQEAQIEFQEKCEECLAQLFYLFKQAVDKDEKISLTENLKDKIKHILSFDIGKLNDLAGQIFALTVLKVNFLLEEKIELWLSFFKDRVDVINPGVTLELAWLRLKQPNSIGFHLLIISDQYFYRNFFPRADKIILDAINFGMLSGSGCGTSGQLNKFSSQVGKSLRPSKEAMTKFIPVLERVAELERDSTLSLKVASEIHSSSYQLTRREMDFAGNLLSLNVAFKTAHLNVIKVGKEVGLESTDFMMAAAMIKLFFLRIRIAYMFSVAYFFLEKIHFTPHFYEEIIRNIKPHYFFLNANRGSVFVMGVKEILDEIYNQALLQSGKVELYEKNTKNNAKENINNIAFVLYQKINRLIIARNYAHAYSECRLEHNKLKKREGEVSPLVTFIFSGAELVSYSGALFSNKRYLEGVGIGNREKRKNNKRKGGKRRNNKGRGGKRKGRSNREQKNNKIVYNLSGLIELCENFSRELIAAIESLAYADDDFLTMSIIICVSNVKYARIVGEAATKQYKSPASPHRLIVSEENIQILEQEKLFFSAIEYMLNVCCNVLSEFKRSSMVGEEIAEVQKILSTIYDIINEKTQEIDEAKKLLADAGALAEKFERELIKEDRYKKARECFERAKQNRRSSILKRRIAKNSQCEKNNDPFSGGAEKAVKQGSKKNKHIEEKHLSGGAEKAVKQDSKKNKHIEEKHPSLVSASKLLLGDGYKNIESVLRAKKILCDMEAKLKFNPQHNIDRVTQCKMYNQLANCYYLYADLESDSVRKVSEGLLNVQKYSRLGMGVAVRLKNNNIKKEFLSSLDLLLFCATQQIDEIKKSIEKEKRLSDSRLEEMIAQRDRCKEESGLDWEVDKPIDQQSQETHDRLNLENRLRFLKIALRDLDGIKNVFQGLKNDCNSRADVSNMATSSGKVEVKASGKKRKNRRRRRKRNGSSTQQQPQQQLQGPQQKPEQRQEQAPSQGQEQVQVTKGAQEQGVRPRNKAQQSTDASMLSDSAGPPVPEKKQSVSSKKELKSIRPFDGQGPLIRDGKSRKVSAYGGRPFTILQRDASVGGNLSTRQHDLRRRNPRRRRLVTRVIESSKLPEVVNKLMTLISGYKGHEIYMVGGIVRSLLFGDLTKLDDVDFISTIKEEDLSGLNIEYQECEHIKNRIKVTKIDGAEVDLDLDVKVDQWLKERGWIGRNVRRRDFYCNSAYIRFERPKARSSKGPSFFQQGARDYEIVDLTGKCIVHNKEKIIQPLQGVRKMLEEPLLILRAVKLIAKYDFKLQDGILEKLINGLQDFSELKVGVKVYYLSNFFKADYASKVVKFLSDTGFLEKLFDITGNKKTKLNNSPEKDEKDIMIKKIRGRLGDGVFVLRCVCEYFSEVYPDSPLKTDEDSFYHQLKESLSSEGAGNEPSGLYPNLH